MNFNTVLLIAGGIIITGGIYDITCKLHKTIIIFNLMVYALTKSPSQEDERKSAEQWINDGDVFDEVDD